MVFHALLFSTIDLVLVRLNSAASCYERFHILLRRTSGIPCVRYRGCMACLAPHSENSAYLDSATPTRLCHCDRNYADDRSRFESPWRSSDAGFVCARSRRGRIWNPRRCSLPSIWRHSSCRQLVRALAAGFSVGISARSSWCKGKRSKNLTGRAEAASKKA